MSRRLMLTYGNTWAKRARWPTSHYIRGDGYASFNGTIVALTACGRHVTVNQLDPEPTGIDTVNRCKRCLTKTGAEE